MYIWSTNMGSICVEKYLVFLLVFVSAGSLQVSALPFLPSWISEVTDFHSFEVVFTPNQVEDTERIRRSAEIKIEDTIREVIKHYQNKDPRGLPGSLVPDPMPIAAEVDQTLAGADIHLDQMVLTGLKQFELRNVSVDLSKQEFMYEVFLSSLTALGKYKLEYFWSEYVGNFNITLLGVKAQGKGILEVGQNGTVLLNDVQTDVTFDDIDMVFEKLGGVAYIIQGAINMMGSLIFEAIKPLTLDKANQRLAENVNTKLKELNEEVLFSDSIPVLDVAVFKARKLIRDNEYDPLVMPNIEQSNSMGIDIRLTNGVLTGLSTVHRTGDISVGMQQYVAKATISLGTQRITGRYHWRVTAFGFIERHGFIRFSVDSLKVQARLSQSLDLRQPPTIDDLDIELGTLTLRSEGAGSLDYAFEMGVNSFPNLFKNVVVNAIERPLMWVIGNQMSAVDMEKLLLDNIPAAGFMMAQSGANEELRQQQQQQQVVPDGV